MVTPVAPVPHDELPAFIEVHLTPTEIVYFTSRIVATLAVTKSNLADDKLDRQTRTYWLNMQEMCEGLINKLEAAINGRG